MKIISPKVSIIVPVYKAEAYLHRCVDSLLAQTFTEFEILLVDDGSPDNSGVICDEYARKDSRVRVFHKKNGGVSSARQCGIDNALGEYTIHADPDDWVDYNMLEELYAKAKKDDADMVICDFYEEFQERQIYQKQQPSQLNNKTVFRELFQHLHCSCWNKLIKRDCYNKYNVYFPKEMNLWEDGYVMYNLTLKDIRISYLPKAFYHYDNFTNEHSIVRKPTVRTLQSMKYLISFLENEVNENITDLIYIKKKNVKMLSFSMQEISYKDFYKLYNEINESFMNDLLNQSHKKFGLLTLIAVCLKYNNCISVLLRNLYLSIK